MDDDDPEDSSYSATPVTARSDVSSASLLSKVIKVIIYTISRTNFESIILILKLTLYINIIVGGWNLYTCLKIEEKNFIFNTTQQIYSFMLKMLENAKCTAVCFEKNMLLS